MKKIFSAALGFTFFTALMCCVNMPVQAEMSDGNMAMAPSAGHECCPDRNDSQSDSLPDCIGHADDDDGVKMANSTIAKLPMVTLPHTEVYSAEPSLRAPPLILTAPGTTLINEYTERKTSIVLRT